MINKIYIMLIGIALLPTALSAQQLYKEDDMIVLNLTTTSGMPAGAVTNTPKGSTEADLSTVEANTRVYIKLEVAPEDILDVEWTDSFSACSDATFNGRTGWRMPTQRELQLIMLFKNGIDNISGTTLSGCWSATKANRSGDVFVVGTNSTGVYSINNNDGSLSKKRIRCVREIK